MAPLAVRWPRVYQRRRIEGSPHCPYWAIISGMPAPNNERQAFERERAELPDQIATYQRELDATPAENKARRERLAWLIRRNQKRLVEIERRLAALGP